MKFMLILAATLGACAPVPEFTPHQLRPFVGKVSPDGERTWTFVVTKMVRDYYRVRPDSDLLAQQMAHERFCSGGYEITGSESHGTSTVYTGICY